MAKPTLTVLSGAGISAESGLRTFRDSGGLWEGYEVSRVASPEGWEENPALVLDFYNQRRRDVLAAAPNAAHEALARLEASPYRQAYTRPLEIRTGVNRRRQLNLFDPDGTRIELMESRTVDGTPPPPSTLPLPHKS